MDYIRKYWYIVIITIVILAYVVFSMTYGAVHSTEDLAWEESMIDVESEMDHEKVEEEEKTPHVFFIDIKGEIISPGVYEIQESNRVIDVITMAGGFTEFAEQKGVNLAERVRDEMVIYVPRQGEVPSNWTSLQGPTSNTSILVNINYAQKVELETLPGIGPSKADAIIAYREENGLFQSIDDLDKVSGIGEKSLEKLREFITVK